MKLGEVDKIKRHGRLILGPLGFLSHYMAISFLLIILTVSISVILIQNKDSGNSVALETADIPTLVIILLVLSLIIFLTQRLRLKFKTENIALSEDEIAIVIKSTGEDIGWILERFSRNVIQGRLIRYGGLVGQRVTILIDNGTIMINTVSLYGEITGHGRDAKITDLFFTNLKKRSFQLEHQKASS